MAKQMKEKIIEATLELADEKGLGRISISQIATKVGLKKSSIYSHYSSKDEIIEAMYTYFRKQTVEKRTTNQTIDTIVDGKSFKDILKLVVKNYIEMNEEENMHKFYRLILSERTINPIAAEIMVQETNTMIEATKQLFNVVQQKGIVSFKNIDNAALLFALGIHSAMEYEMDAKLSISKPINAVDTFIDEFCMIYEGKD